MWTCPKCQRDFKQTNQGHYCGEKPKIIADYISQQDQDKQADLELMRQSISLAIPDAEEGIAWSMPTFSQKRHICHFAAAKHHIGFYPGAAAVAHFAEQLKDYKTDKGTIRIPYGQIDQELVKTIARWCYENGEHR